MLAFIPRNLFARTGPGPLGSGLPVWTSRLCLSVACFSSWDSHRSSTPQKKKVRVTRMDNTAGVPLTRTKAIGPDGTSHHSFRTLQSVLLCDEIWRFPQPCGKHPARLHVESSNVTRPRHRVLVTAVHYHSVHLRSRRRLGGGQPSQEC